MEKWIREQITRKRNFSSSCKFLARKAVICRLLFSMQTTRNILHSLKQNSPLEIMFTPYLEHLKNVALDAEVSAHLSFVTRPLTTSYSFSRYMKYLYPYECEKKHLSTPAELQAAIDGNRREGRRTSYGQFESQMQQQLQLVSANSWSSDYGDFMMTFLCIASDATITDPK